MMFLKSAVLAGVFALSAQAFAYAEKTYQCKNVEGLPDNTYTFQNVTLAPGITAPFLEITRHYRADENSPVNQSVIKGLATVSSIGTDRQIIMLGSFRLEFEGEVFVNCRQ